MQSKMRVTPIAIATSIGVVGAGLVPNGVVMAGTTMDTISVTVAPSCTFNNVTGETYAGSAVNGAEVGNFNNSGIHEFNVFCNDNSGFAVTATPYDLEATGVESAKISYTDNYVASGVNGLWTALIASTATGVTVTSPAPATGGTIISFGSHTSAGGISFTATYKAYVGSATPAGTYNGTIVYTLSPTGSSNSGSNSNANTNTDTNSGNNDSPTDTPDNTDSNEPTPDNSNSGDLNSNTPGTNTNNTQNSSPLMTTINNNYSTYNTYNTANYQNSGSGTTTTNEPTSTSGTSGSSNNNRTNNGYEQPLGVTSTTTSSNKKSDTFDPTPLLITGALAASGLAAVVLLKNKDKEEDKD